MLAGLDCDKLLGALLTSCPSATRTKLAADSARETERKIDLILRLRKLTRALPAIRTALAGARSTTLLTSIAQILSDDRHEAMANRIDATINDDAVGSMSKGPLASRNARVFAVKAGIKLLLGVARATWQENLQGP